MMEGTTSYSKLGAKEESGVDLTQISLRPISLTDLDDLMLWTSDEKVAMYCTWEPYTSKEEGVNFIQNIASKSLWFRAICLRNHAIGASTFGRVTIDARTKLLNLVML
jgi:RimJ/RimL family protein N-acetyltransferase